LCYVGSEFVGPVGAIKRSVGWHAGAAAPDLFGATFVVCGWSSSVAWATRRLVRAALRLVTEQGKPEWRLRARMCLFCAMVALCRVGDEALLFVRFFDPFFPQKWGHFVRFLGSVFLINWVNRSS
jgi:Mn2+/Fe2+ NRAMP family transporter